MTKVVARLSNPASKTISMLLWKLWQHNTLDVAHQDCDGDTALIAASMNVLGREIRRQIAEPQQAGSHSPKQE
jgi:hypothetical protein